MEVISNEKSVSNKTANHKETCPFSKIIEDVFRLNKSQGNTQINNSERAKLFLHSIANITSKKDEVSQAKLVDDIIAAINRIKNDITQESNSETKMNEAIILNPENKDATEGKAKIKLVTKIKSGIEDKSDIVHQNNTTKKEASNNTTETQSTTTERTNYIEILTIEPNNTHKNNISSNNIIEVLKHLMPMFNTTASKELHNITIIEKNINRNHSYSTTKNVSTIILTYCDKENSTRSNATLESDQNADSEVDDYDYYGENYDSDENDEDDPEMSEGDKREILEAADYGMQKMHELYSVLEPKLYSMGFWLDNTNPARYVAAFNAPSEDSTRFTRYGYASLQAATKLKELI
ncbi:putative oxidase/peroxidase, partial [Operophtera brumata]